MPITFGFIFRIAFVFFLGFGCVSSYANNETLSFRYTAQGTIEAVVSESRIYCKYNFFEPSNSVSINGNIIAITSQPYGSYACFPLELPGRYEVVANLGKLNASVYQVTWSQPLFSGGALMISASLVPSSLMPVSIPTLSWPSLIALAMQIAMITVWFTRRKRRVRG
jgi:hypothetical protein